jgi:hypothetical protein
MQDDNRRDGMQMLLLLLLVAVAIFCAVAILINGINLLR